MATLVIAATAVYGAAVNVGDASALATPYGGIVIFKILLFFVLLSLGGVNRYLNIPSLRKAGGMPPAARGFAGEVAMLVAPLLLPQREGRSPLRAFRTAVRAEAILMALVLLLAAILRHEPAPSRPSQSDLPPVQGSHLIE